MKYITTEETIIMTADFKTFTLKAGRVFELQGDYFVYPSKPELKVMKQLIIGNPAWKEVGESYTVELTEDNDIDLETPRKWKLEMVFTATTEDAIKIKEAAGKAIGAMMDKLNISY